MSASSFYCQHIFSFHFISFWHELFFFRFLIANFFLLSQHQTDLTSKKTIHQKKSYRKGERKKSDSCTKTLLVCIKFLTVLWTLNFAEDKRRTALPVVLLMHNIQQLAEWKTEFKKKKHIKERKGKAVESWLSVFVAYMISGRLEWMTIMVRLENSR